MILGQKKLQQRSENKAVAVKCKKVKMVAIAAINELEAKEIAVANTIFTI